ncbi:MAG: ribosome recycling factor [Erysipelotrichaceae bacterium]|jgi:ribosome recycling factor|nr:ribosome recycling factor [Erysipelotrichaceae bacterium]
MDDIALELKEKGKRTIEVLKSNFATIRTGRANAAILDRVECDYYGDKMPIKDICSINAPEPRMLVIKPYDAQDVKTIVAAINASDIGINPIVDSNTIRLAIPALNEERRRELVKTAKRYSEDSKVAIRNLRRDYIDLIKSDETISENLEKVILEDIQKAVDSLMKDIDNLTQEKEKEIMSV